MKKVALMGLSGLMFVSAAANAISFNGSAGQDYTHLGFGLGTDSAGLAMTGGWTHNDDDGDAASLGLGFNVPLGPFLATVGGKGIYTNPNDGDEGYAAAVGGGLQWKIGDSFGLFGEYYYSRIPSPAASTAIRKLTPARAGPSCVQSPSKRVIAI